MRKLNPLKCGLRDPDGGERHSGRPFERGFDHPRFQRSSDSNLFHGGRVSCTAFGEDSSMGGGRAMEPPQIWASLAENTHRGVVPSRKGKTVEPANAPGITIEDWMVWTSMKEGNYDFYADPASLKGMDESTWPPLLKESLLHEKQLITALMGDGDRGGTFIDMGCGTGRDLGEESERSEKVIAIDFSMPMLEEAARTVASLPPEQAARIVLVRGDMADRIPIIEDDSAHFAACRFFTYGNLNLERQERTLVRGREFLKGSTSKNIYPLVFSVYLENEAARRLQEEFYENMCLKVVTSTEDAARGLSVAKTPQGNTLRSERFSPGKLAAILKQSGMAPLFEDVTKIRLSEAAVAVVAIVAKNGERGDLNLGADIVRMVNARIG